MFFWGSGVQRFSSATAINLDATTFRAQLAAKLQDLKLTTIVGARLGPLIDGALPEGVTYRDFLSTDRSPRLRNFVDRFLNDLVCATDERQGADVVYSILPSRDAEVVPGTAQGQLWKSFVAIKPSRKLLFDTRTTEIAALPSHANVPDGCSVIPPASFDEHRGICERFVTHLAATERDTAELEAITADFDEQSYPMWLAVLRSSSPPLDREWGEFRQDELLNVFRGRLRELSVADERAEQLVTQLQLDHLQARGVLTTATPTEPTHGGNVTSAKELRDRRARDLLHAAVDKMNYEQMQNLSLPFGILLQLAESLSA